MRIPRPLLFAALAFLIACGSGDVAHSSEASALNSNSKKPSPLCITPWGVDLCALTGVNTAFVLVAYLDGRPVPAGSWWTPAAPLAVNARGGLPDYPLSYAPDYVTAYPNEPMKDFISKLVKFTVVVDPGTHQERSYVYTDPAKHLSIMTFGDWWGTAPYFLPFGGLPTVLFTPTLHPLSMGPHEVYFIFTLSAVSCDGFPSWAGEPLTVEGGHCFPEGDTRFYPDLDPAGLKFSFAQ